MAEQDVPAVLVSDLVNVRYLTGFTGSSGAALVLADGSTWLSTDGRYDLQSAAECPDVERVITRDGLFDLVAQAQQSGQDRIGFEDRDLTVARYRDLTEDTHTEWVAVGAVVTRLRMVKDDLELRLLREACAATDEALARTLPRIGPGVTERQVARWLDDTMRDLVPEGPGFDTIVAAGENSAIPHHAPTDRAVRSGDLLKMDFGAMVGGYHADMTRTVVVGTGPADWQQEIYGVVASAQQAGRDALGPEATGTGVDRAARTVVEDAGYGKAFSHGLGHGVGLVIHEAPFLGATSPDRLAAAVPVTVEPGVYLPGRGGVRIEDTVVVTEGGCRPLTTAPKELVL